MVGWISASDSRANARKPVLAARDVAFNASTWKTLNRINRAVN